jgi:hypothetical protein
VRGYRKVSTSDNEANGWVVIDSHVVRLGYEYRSRSLRKDAKSEKNILVWLISSHFRMLSSALPPFSPHHSQPHISPTVHTNPTFQYQPLSSLFGPATSSVQSVLRRPKNAAVTEALKCFRVRSQVTVGRAINTHRCVTGLRWNESMVGVRGS